MTGARVARFGSPGPWWYLAACVECRWVGLDWKHKEQAVLDRDDHNAREHPAAAASQEVGS